MFDPQRTVEDFKYIDLEKYKVKRFIPFKALLDQLLIRTTIAYFAQNMTRLTLGLFTP